LRAIDGVGGVGVPQRRVPKGQRGSQSCAPAPSENNREPCLCRIKLVARLRGSPQRKCPAPRPPPLPWQPASTLTVSTPLSFSTTPAHLPAPLRLPTPASVLPASLRALQQPGRLTYSGAPHCHLHAMETLSPFDFGVAYPMQAGLSSADHNLGSYGPGAGWGPPSCLRCTSCGRRRPC